MIEEFKNGVDLVQLAITIVSVSVVFFQYIKFQRWVNKRNKKLKEDLQTPLLLCEMKENNLANVETMLTDFNFNVKNRSHNLTNLGHSQQKTMIIIGYEDIPGTTDKIQTIITFANARKLPVVVYAAPRSISIKDSDIISSYSFSEVCNSDLRLVMTLANICQYFDYDPANYKTRK